MSFVFSLKQRGHPQRSAEPPTRTHEKTKLARNLCLYAVRSGPIFFGTFLAYRPAMIIREIPQRGVHNARTWILLVLSFVLNPGCAVDENTSAESFSANQLDSSQCPSFAERGKCTYDAQVLEQLKQALKERSGMMNGTCYPVVFSERQGQVPAGTIASFELAETILTGTLPYAALSPDHAQKSNAALSSDNTKVVLNLGGGVFLQTIDGVAAGVDEISIDRHTHPLLLKIAEDGKPEEVRSYARALAQSRLFPHDITYPRSSTLSGTPRTDALRDILRGTLLGEVRDLHAFGVSFSGHLAQMYFSFWQGNTYLVEERFSTNFSDPIANDFRDGLTHIYTHLKEGGRYLVSPVRTGAEAAVMRYFAREAGFTEIESGRIFDNIATLRTTISEAVQNKEPYAASFRSRLPNPDRVLPIWDDVKDTRTFVKSVADLYQTKFEDLIYIIFQKSKP